MGFLEAHLPEEPCRCVSCDSVDTETPLSRNGRNEKCDELATCALVLDFRFECDVPNLNFRMSGPVGHEAADKSPVSLGDEFNTFAIELE